MFCTEELVSVVIMLVDAVKQSFLNQHVDTARTAGNVTKRRFTVGYPSIPNIPVYTLAGQLLGNLTRITAELTPVQMCFSQRLGLTAELRFKSDGWGGHSAVMLSAKTASL